MVPKLIHIFPQRHSSHANQSQSDDEDTLGGSPSKKRTRKRFNSSGVDMELGHDDDDEEEDSDEDSMGEDTVSKDLLNSTQTPPCSPIKSLNNSSSPVGINRR